MLKSQKPVTTVILTHSDGDHVNGLAAFPTGLTIIAHEGNKKEQEAAISAGGRGAPPADKIPTFLPDQKIVFTGDIIAAQRPDPLIHLEKNGSSEGWITTTKGIVALKADQFVPGHGDVQTKAGIEKRLTDTEAKRATIKELVGQGKSLDEIKAAVGDPPAAPAGGRGPNFASFTEVVYQELTKKRG